MANPYALQGYLNKLKLQTRELLKAAHTVLEDFPTPTDGDMRDDWRTDSITELAAAVAETEALLRK